MGWMLPTIVVSSVMFAAVIGFLARPLGRLLGLMDYPDPVGGRKRHVRVTPLLGGTAVMLPVLLTLVWQTLLAFAAPATPDLSSSPLSLSGPSPVVLDVVWLGLGAGAFYLLGLADDRFDLAAMPRLLSAVGVFTLVMTVRPAFMLEALNFHAMQQRLVLGDFGPLFTLLCLVGLLNAINMADGKNGLVIGLCLIWTACIAAFAPPGLAPLLASLAASLAVALLFNLNGRFFLGDGGSYGLSALLGLLVIYVYNSPGSGLGAARAAVWFAVPVMDCLRLMLMRLSRGRSPFSGDREHLHHWLGKLAGWPRGLLIYWAMVGVPCLATFVLPHNGLEILLVQVLSYSMFMAIVYRRQAVQA